MSALALRVSQEISVSSAPTPRGSSSTPRDLVSVQTAPAVTSPQVNSAIHSLVNVLVKELLMLNSLDVNV